jgi:hypothetical protein
VSGPSGAATKLCIPGSTLESKIKSLKINKNRFKATEIVDLGWGNPERLANLQKLVCELLAKNQRLRIELMARRVESSTGTFTTRQEVYRGDIRKF